MIQTRSIETLQSELQDELAVLRGAQEVNLFRVIAKLAAAWLGSHRLSIHSIDTHFSVRPEQLLSVVSFAEQDSTKLRGQNRTWAKVAAAIVTLTPEMYQLYRSAQQDPDRSIARACLSHMVALASSAPLPSSTLSDVIQRLRALTPQSRAPRDFQPGVMSSQTFSEGLRESLFAYNEELRYLTVGQVDALATSFQSRRVWVQGPAGSGKTVFAIEAAYRALRAGLRTLFVFRSTQFKYILADLLQSVSDKLYLLPHIDFMYLLRQVELHGPSSEAFMDIACHHFPDLEGATDLPLWDQVIVDDCGTFETHMPFRMLEIDKLSHRVILLAAPDQIISHIMFDHGTHVPEPSKDCGLGTLNDVVGVLDQDLAAPDGYDVVTLERNVRNARCIASYIGQVTGGTIDVGLRSLGQQLTRQTTWANITEDIVSVVSAGLSVYEPGRIKIVVDPHLWHPKLSSVSPERYYDARSALVKQLEPLCGALIVATMGGSFLHTTMEADEELRRVLAENRQRTPLFVSTDGETVLVISIEELKDTHQRQIAPGLASWGFGGRIDAVGLLDPNALSDPFETTNAILIYQAPLFIGMEADMIIYVRNRHEPFETHTELEPSTIERLRHARQQHHFLAMSRAKHSLIDLILESD